jgi:hypothetical protein
LFQNHVRMLKKIMVRWIYRYTKSLPETQSVPFNEQNEPEYMPRNILPNRFYLKKKNYEEIKRPFIIKISGVEKAEA